METKTAIICSLPDQASVNIADHILKSGVWKEAVLPSAEKMDEALSLYPITIPEDGCGAEREKKDAKSAPEDENIIYDSGTPDVFRPPENESSRLTKIVEQGPLRLIFLDGRHVFQDRLDKRLSFLGFPADRIVFLSKHKSRTEIRSLTVHSTGNIGKAILGGSSSSLSVPDPILLQKILIGLKNGNEAAGLNYDVTMEVTHHGPTDLEIPSLFVEIGSTENEWTNPAAGKVAAEAVMKIKDYLKDNPDGPENRPSGKEEAGKRTIDSRSGERLVAVGFGGGHYADRQTKWLLAEKIRFGHIFPKHHIGYLTEEIIEEAFDKSGADVAYFDKKSIKGDDRRRIEPIIEEMGYTVLTDKDFTATENEDAGRQAHGAGQKRMRPENANPDTGNNRGAEKQERKNKSVNRNQEGDKK